MFGEKFLTILQNCSTLFSAFIYVSPNFFSSNSEANFLAVPRFPVSFVASLSYCQQAVHQAACTTADLSFSQTSPKPTVPVHQSTCSPGSPAHQSICPPAYLSIRQPVRQLTYSSVNLSASLPVNQATCPPAYLFLSKSVYQRTCPTANLPASLPVHHSTWHQHVCHSTCLYQHTYTYLSVNLFSILPAHLSTCPPSYLSISQPAH